jgi:TolB-like protein/DNA-binding winged helix-turn-helix (wHTH) protein/Flp pilus assembly protein TadD
MHRLRIDRRAGSFRGGPGTDGAGTTLEASSEIYQFGRLTLLPKRRALLCDGVPLVLTARAFDMLELLVRRRERVLTREEIVAHVWQGFAVGENNLTVQMSTLRRVLAEHSETPLIATVPGRGYQFVGEVTVLRSVQADMAEMTGLAANDVPGRAGADGSGNRAGPRRRHWAWSGRPALAVLIALLLAGTAGALLLRARRPGPPPLSLAVLPFRNLTVDHALEYQADGLTDDLTTDLARLPGSVVIARESAALFRGRTISPTEIGRQLNVRYLVGGSLRVDDRGYHVNGELIDAGSGGQLWAGHFDFTREQMRAAPDVVVRRIVSALDFQLGQLVSARSLKDRPDDPDALDLFFRARAIEDRDDSLKGLAQAQLLLEQAVRQRPDFGDALAELGSVLLHKVTDMDDPNDTEDYAEARRIIAQALKVSPRNSQALADQGRAFAIDGKWTEARYSATAALEIEPSNIRALSVLASCAVQQGHLTDAVPVLEKILQLLPDSPANKPRYTTLGYIRLLQGQTEEALDLLHRAIAGEGDPKAGDEAMGRAEFTRLLIAAATDIEGDTEHARDLYRAASAVWPDRTVWRLNGYLPRTAAALPGYHRVLEALHDAGMPWAAGERDGATSMEAPCAGDDFARSPPGLAGGDTLTTQELASRLSTPPYPLIIDTGRGQAALDNAVMFVAATPIEPLTNFLDRVMAERVKNDRNAPVVLMGDGPYGCTSYDAASYLVSKGYRQVAWYRGGEEAWSAHGLKSHDLRP